MEKSHFQKHTQEITQHIINEKTGIIILKERSNGII
jgi:hypothetical protein